MSDPLSADRADLIGLVNRIADTWHHPDGWTRGNRNAWYHGLEDLDIGSAGRTLAVLTRSEEKLPSIKTFRDAYRTQHTPYLDPVERCAACDGHGWTEAPDLETGGRPDRPDTYPAWHPKAGQPMPAHTYSQVRPCPECPDGDRAREQLTRWTTATTTKTRKRAS